MYRTACTYYGMCVGISRFDYGLSFHIIIVIVRVHAVSVYDIYWQFVLHLINRRIVE